MTDPRDSRPDLLPELLGGPRIDLTNCEREPIHIPGSVQPHGVLLALDPRDLRVVQASSNTSDMLGLTTSELLGHPLTDFVEARGLLPLRRHFGGPEPERAPPYTFSLRVSDALVFDATAHACPGLLILELERPDPRAGSSDFYHAIRNGLSALEGAADLAALYDVAARHVRELSGFDRVMVYRFAEDDSGEVVAEAKVDYLHSYLGQRFPESDIPKQARALYLKHMLRLTADVNAAPAPLEPLVNPVTGRPLDMGGAVLRSTSPMHLQYLRNMGVASSLSVSIVQDGRLWGLISCHHLSPKFVPQATRSALEFLGRVLALQITAKRQSEIFAFRERLEQTRRVLVDAATSSLTPARDLARHGESLLAFGRATGAAYRLENATVLVGATPPSEEIDRLLDWLRTRDALVVHTDRLSREIPGAAGLTDRASGLLAVSVTGRWDEFLMWFRPEIPTTVTWGGDPHKPVEVAASGESRLTPRRSFDAYVETVRGASAPWHPGELEEAEALRLSLAEAAGTRLASLRALNDQLGRTNEELARTNEELRQFAYATAHDLQEPLRTLAGLLDLFGARYASQLDASADKLIAFALGEAGRLRALIQDLYAYLEVGTADQELLASVSLDRLAGSVVRGFQAQIEEREAVVVIDPLPDVWGNDVRLQQVFHHLIGNALKFTRRAPRVHVSAERRGAEWRVHVRDEGIGIAPAYHEQIFAIFQRLNRREDYDGNGIGLAIARKIVERHGGRLWVESRPGSGATFTFTLPATEEPHVQEI